MGSERKMSKDFTKLALRRHSIKRWKKGRIKAYGEEPTEAEFHSFIAGFNMGYDAHKTKRLK